MTNSVKNPLKSVSVLDDKGLGDRLKEIKMSPKRIEDIIKERWVERIRSK